MAQAGNRLNRKVQPLNYQPTASRSITQGGVPCLDGAQDYPNGGNTTTPHSLLCFIRYSCVVLAVSVLTAVVAHASVRFDGNGDAIHMPHGDELNLDSTFTYMVWVYPEGWPPDQWHDLHLILGKWNDCGGGLRQYALYLRSTDARAKAYVSSDGTGGGPPSTVSAAQFPLSQWHHIAYVHDDNSGKVYVNGVLDASRDDLPSSIYQSSTMFYVGGNCSRFFQGYVAEVQVWDRVLSESEINTYKDRQLAGSEAGLVGYWPLNETSGAIVQDLAGVPQDGTLQNDATLDPFHAPVCNGTGDADGDGILDECDNCPNDYNPDQVDCDGDGIGDVCDSDITDSDGDGIADACDNCPLDVNADQADQDNDGLGDICDDDSDADGIPNDGDASGTVGDTPCPDGVTVGCDDNCWLTANPAQDDADSDGHGDACDNCPVTTNNTQSDTDGDDIGDACDNCVLTPNQDQANSELRNVAASADGGSATADCNQSGYNIAESIDGVLTGSGNGWAVAGCSVPHDGVYAFADSRTVNEVKILSGVDRSNHNLKDFELWFTDDVTPGLGGNWYPLQDLVFLNDVRGCPTEC